MSTNWDCIWVNEKRQQRQRDNVQSEHQTKNHGNDADVLIETWGWHLQSADWNPPYDEGIFCYQLQIFFVFLALRSLRKDYTPGKFTNVTQKRYL